MTALIILSSLTLAAMLLMLVLVLVFVGRRDEASPHAEHYLLTMFADVTDQDQDVVGSNLLHENIEWLNGRIPFRVMTGYAYEQPHSGLAIIELDDGRELVIGMVYDEYLGLMQVDLDGLPSEDSLEAVKEE